MITHDPRWSLPRGNTLVPSRWQATAMRAPITWSEEKQQAGLQVTHSMAGARTASRARLKVVQACEPARLRQPRARASPGSGRTRLGKKPDCSRSDGTNAACAIMAAGCRSRASYTSALPRSRLHNLKAQHVGQLGHYGYGSHNPRASCTAARGRLRLQPLCNREAPDGCCP